MVAVGVGLVIVLVAGGAAAAVAVMNGSLVASTTVISIAVASVGVVIVALIIAMVTVRDTPAPDEHAERADGDGSGPERDPAARRSAADTGEIRFPTPADAQQPAAVPRGDDRNLEVFSRIASRLQAKVSRAFVDLDALERRIEDPELLATVFSLDHLVTRIRREVENLAVLGGDVPQARSSQPAEVNQVLRLAVASSEHYQRIMTYPLRGVKIHGHVVAELINLLAELLDNATAFTPPQAPKITLSASRVAAGLAIEVHDRGIGMPPEDIERVNRLLAGYTDVDLHQLLGEGRIGLAVVHRLAPRHGIRVQLRENIFGGIDAAVVIPHNLLSEPDELYAHAAARRRLEAGASSRAGATAGWPQAAPESSTGSSTGGEPPDWPWQPPERHDAAGGEDPNSGRHSRPGVAAPDAPNPSPFPRSRVRVAGGDDVEASGPLTPVAPAASAAEPAAAGGRPALPQRKVGKYLRPELRKPHPTVRVSPGHNVDLLADVTRGREDAELENGYGGH